MNENVVTLEKNQRCDKEGRHGKYLRLWAFKSKLGQCLTELYPTEQDEKNNIAWCLHLSCVIKIKKKINNNNQSKIKD